MITPDDLQKLPFFAPLSPDERATIAARAADVRARAGEWLLHEGESPSFFVLLEGHLTVTKRIGDFEQTINDYVPGTFFGEVPLLLGAPAVASVAATEDSRVLRLGAHDFRELILPSPALSIEILKVMATRVDALSHAVSEGPLASVTIVGPRWDPVCHDLRDFLARNHVSFTWLDPDDVTAWRAADAELRNGPLPLVALADGTRMVAPSKRELAERIGLQTEPHDVQYDVAIIGAGPAGLAAAVYGASEGLRTIAVECEATGGQAGTSSRIENYLGFPNGLSGNELGTRAWRQAIRFGAEILLARRAIALELGDGGHVVALDGGGTIRTRAIVLATGVSWRRLVCDGCDRLVGRGIFYGAARTEALGTRGKDVYLIGGGNSAGQAAIFFADYANSVTILVRGASLADSMSQYLIDQIAAKPCISVKPRCVLERALGADHLEAIEVRNEATAGLERYATDSLFVFIGADAQTQWLPERIVRDRNGYVCTGRDVLDLMQTGDQLHGRDPYLLETSVPGIFAAGDVRHGSVKRVASGVGEGSMSIAFIHQFLQQPAGAVPSEPARAS